MKNFIKILLLLVSANLARATTGTVSGSFSTNFGGSLHANYTPTSCDSGTGAQLVLHFTTDMNFGGFIDLSALVTYSDGHTLTIAGGYSSGDTSVTFSPDGGHAVSSVVLSTVSPWNTHAYPEWGFPGMTGSVTASLVDLPQTCTISNNGAPEVSGQSITGTASGSQGGNVYNISVVSGPASASINSSTGAYTVTATGAGAISYKVWISAGGAYSRSNDAFGGGTSAVSKKVKVTLPANTGNFSIQYTLYQGGVSIGSYTQLPGNGAYILTIDVGADGGPVTVTSTVLGLKKDSNGNFITDPTSEISTGGNQTVTPSADPSATAVDVVPPPGNAAKDPSLPSTKSDTVWQQSPQSTTDPTTQTDLLTNATYREGVDKVVQGQKAISDSLVTGVDASDTLDTSPLPTTVSVDISDQVSGILAKLPDKPTFVAPTTSTTVSITLPFITGLSTVENFSFTWDFGPWVTPLAWLRVFFNGILSVFFFFAVTRQLRDSVAN